MNNDRHPLDKMEEDAKASQDAFIKQALMDSSLVYNVFSSEHGQKLLDRWKEVLIWSPTVSRGDDQVTMGINEGYKSFIRSILKAVKYYEDQA